jgi:hypothetical protein
LRVEIFHLIIPSRRRKQCLHLALVLSYQLKINVMKGYEMKYPCSCRDIVSLQLTYVNAVVKVMLFIGFVRFMIGRLELGA